MSRSFLHFAEIAQDPSIYQISASASQIAEIGNGEDITDFDNSFNTSRFIARMLKEIPASMSELLAAHGSNK